MTALYFKIEKGRWYARCPKCSGEGGFNGDSNQVCFCCLNRLGLDYARVCWLDNYWWTHESERMRHLEESNTIGHIKAIFDTQLNPAQARVRKILREGGKQEW